MRFSARPPRASRPRCWPQHTFGRRTIRLRSSHGGTCVASRRRYSATSRCRPTSSGPTAQADCDRYQTVYAPPARLHPRRRQPDSTSRQNLLAALEARGVARAEITLHVGYGTFEPVRTDIVEEHRIHPEPFEIDRRAAATIATAQRDGRRVVSVGTTTTRTIEAVAADNGGVVQEASGEASLFIYPGFRFQVAGGLLTNFHLPKSSLLLLVCAFAGTDSRWRPTGTRSARAIGSIATGMRCSLSDEGALLRLRGSP